MVTAILTLSIAGNSVASAFSPFGRNVNSNSGKPNPFMEDMNPDSFFTDFHNVMPYVLAEEEIRRPSDYTPRGDGDLINLSDQGILTLDNGDIRFEETFVTPVKYGGMKGLEDKFGDGLDGDVVVSVKLECEDLPNNLCEVEMKFSATGELNKDNFAWTDSIRVRDYPVQPFAKYMPTVNINHRALFVYYDSQGNVRYAYLFDSQEQEMHNGWTVNNEGAEMEITGTFDPSTALKKGINFNAGEHKSFFDQYPMLSKKAPICEYDYDAHQYSNIPCVDTFNSLYIEGDKVWNQLIDRTTSTIWGADIGLTTFAVSVEIDDDCPADSFDPGNTTDNNTQNLSWEEFKCTDDDRFSVKFSHREDFPAGQYLVNGLDQFESKTDLKVNTLVRSYVDKNIIIDKNFQPAWKDRFKQTGINHLTLTVVPYYLSVSNVYQLYEDGYWFKPDGSLHSLNWLRDDPYWNKWIFPTAENPWNINDDVVLTGEATYNDDADQWVTTDHVPPYTETGITGNTSLSVGGTQY